MASSLLDVCRFTPAAGSTTDWAYSSAVTGYQSPSAAGVVNGATYSYRAESSDLSQWEVGTGTYNTGTNVLSRGTVLFNSLGTTNKVNFSAAPQVAVVALAEDLVRSIAGVAGALTVSKGVAVVGSDIERSFAEATFQGGPANPTGTANTTGLMMGLGSTFKITPNSSGRIKIDVQGSGAVTVATASFTVKLLYGTGTAPANATAITGTQAGGTMTGWSGVANEITPFYSGAIVTGLTLGTQVWIDLSLAVSTGTGSLSGVSCCVMEF